MDRTAWRHVFASLATYIRAHEGETLTGEEWFERSKASQAVRRMPVEDVRAEALRAACRELLLERLADGRYRAVRARGRVIG